MKAHVISDKSTRKIELELDGLPDLDVTESWHRRPRVIRPFKATIVVSDGETRSINILGGVIKASGQPSDTVRDGRTYHIKAYREHERVENAPGWVRELFEQAPSGIVEFTWTSDQEAL